MGYMKELDILSGRPETKVYIAEGGIQNDLILINIKDSEGIAIEDDGFEYDDLLTATCAETGQKLRRIRGDCYNIVELTDYSIKEYEDMFGKIKR